jgi:hypothetical protein
MSNALTVLKIFRRQMGATTGYEPSGREFESLRARHIKQRVTSFVV